MTDPDEKEKHKLRLERMKRDKEARKRVMAERRLKIEPYTRNSPRDLVEDYYLGRLTNEDS